MIPILYNSTETNFTQNGIGWLKDCTKCTVTEELNGIYECEFQYPMMGQFYSCIVPDRIVKLKSNETSSLQLFRVYRNTKPLNGIVKFYGQHISYDLNGNTVIPFTISSRTNATTVLNSILEHCYYAHRFTAVSTSSTQSKFELKVPVSSRKCLGGMEGSILDNFKGEFEFDNFIIRHHSSRGQDNGVTIQYSKNLTDIKADTSIADTYTSVYPYATDEDGDYYELPEKVIELPSKSRYAEPRMLQLDLSDKFDSETRITAELLRKYTNEYISNNKIDDIKQNLKVSFVQLWQTEEYKNIAVLERVKLGDTVTVKYPELGVSVKAKVIKTVYDVLNEKYIEIELGQAKSNFANTLNKVNSELKTMSDFMRNQPSLMEKAISHATEMLTGGLGGYKVEVLDEKGYTKETLYMDTLDKATAKDVMRINQNGIGFSRGNGYNGPFQSAWLLDGSFNADFITAGTLNANLIKAGTIEDLQHNTSIDMTNGQITMNWLQNSKLALNKTGLILRDVDGLICSAMQYTVDQGGIISTNRLKIGTYGSEAVTIDKNGYFFVKNGRMRLLNSLNQEAMYLYVDNDNKGVISTNKLSADELSIDGIGSFFRSTSHNSVLKTDIVMADNIQPKTTGGIINMSAAIVSGITSHTSFKLTYNNSDVGSFFVNTNGRSFLRTNVLEVDGHQYHDTAITVNGQTYYVLART